MRRNSHAPIILERKAMNTGRIDVLDLRTLVVVVCVEVSVANTDVVTLPWVTCGESFCHLKDQLVAFPHSPILTQTIIIVCKFGVIRYDEGYTLKSLCSLFQC